MTHADDFSGCGFAMDPRFAYPGTDVNYGRDRTFRTDHVLLDLNVNISRRSLACSATLTLTAIVPGTKSIVLDAVDFRITGVFVGNEKADYHYDKKTLTVHFKKPLHAATQTTVRVDYEVANPTLGVYFVTPDKHYPTKPTQAWTQCEPQEARHWFPCFDEPDEKCTTEMLLTVDERFVGLSNGVLVETEHNKKAKTKTYHWRMNHPHSPYLVMFAVGAFSEIKDSWNGISVHYYCEKGREEDTKRAFGKTPQILQFFSERIGTVYPYERYSQVAVADFIFGGMEHTTMTTQTDYALHDERAAEESWSEGLVAHELAHQWFGDLLTCKDWSHAWLNESFATYFDALFLEYDRGTEEFQYDIYKNAQTYFAEDKDRYRRPICTSLFKRPADLFDRHLYEKGSVILHTIRSMLGDELWWKTIKAYVETHSHGAVETNDLINALERTTGRNMRKFFDHWIFNAGHPELKVSYFWSDGKANIRVAQRQRLDEENPTFAIPLEIKVITKKGEHVFHEHVEKRQHLFSYKLAERPVDVRVDYRNIILKKTDVLNPRSMWLYQLENDEYVAGKIAACQEIA